MSLTHVKAINLDRFPERFFQLQAWNPGIVFERFSAIEGRDFTSEDCIGNGLITHENTYSAGVRGAAMSHVALWRACAAGTVPFHIAEDDVVLRADFWERSAELLARVPGWDIVLWTHNFDWPASVHPTPALGNLVIQYCSVAQDVDIDRFRSETVTPMLLPLNSAAAIAFYSISPAGAKRMLEACLPIGNEAAEYVARPGSTWANTALDVEMARHYADMTAYLALPPLALAPNDMNRSTIRGHLAAMHDPAIANRAPQPG
jgi:glycosyl transferase family 25